MPMIGIARSQPQLPPEPLRRAERARDVARVHRREVLRPQEDAAGRQFLDDAAQQGRGERDVIPACDERMDLPRLDADAVQHGQQRRAGSVRARWCSGGRRCSAPPRCCRSDGCRRRARPRPVQRRCCGQRVRSRPDRHARRVAASRRTTRRVRAHRRCPACGIHSARRMRAAAGGDALRQCAEQRVSRTVAAVDHGHCATISSAR